MDNLPKVAYELPPLGRPVQDVTTKSQPLRPGQGRMWAWMVELETWLIVQGHLPKNQGPCV